MSDTTTPDQPAEQPDPPNPFRVPAEAAPIRIQANGEPGVRERAMAEFKAWQEAQPRWVGKPKPRRRM